MSQHSCPCPELSSDTGHRGASDPSVPNSAPLPLPSLCGGDGCCGGEDGYGEKQGERGKETDIHLASIQIQEDAEYLAHVIFFLNLPETL